MQHGLKKGERIEQEWKLKGYLELLSEYEAEKTLDLNTRILEFNPEYYTLWNDRRRMDLQLEKELLFTFKCLLTNPKSYWVWNHRRWIVQQLQNWNQELDLVSKMLLKDARNFHGWDYRRWVVKEGKIEGEFEYTTQKINENFSNFSAWHYRSKLMPHQPDVAEQIEHDFEMVRNAIYTEPGDQSAWLYQRWLLGKPKESILCLDAGCAINQDQMTICILVNHTCQLKTASLHVILDHVPVEVEFKTHQRLLMAKTRKAHHVQIEILQGHILAKRQGLVSPKTVISGSCDQLQIHTCDPIPETSDNVQPKEIWQREYESIKELSELEPDSKWPHLALVHVQEHLGKKQEAIETLKRLIEVDPTHAQYYNDRLVSHRLEQRLHKGKIDLSGKKIASLQDLDILSLCQEIDLSNNRLQSLRYIEGWQAKHLNLSNNQIRDLTGIQSLNLESLDLSNNSTLTDGRSDFQGLSATFASETAAESERQSSHGSRTRVVQMIVFWPDNLRVDDKDCLMGYKTEDYLLIVKTQPDDQLELLGSCVVQRPSAPHYHFLIDPALGIPTGLYYDCELVEAFVFYFTPPKTNRLQYFSDRPLQLDLSGVHPSKDDFYLRNYSTYWSLLDPEPMIDYQELLKKINAVNGLQQMRQESHFDWHRIYTILSWICFIPRVLIELLLYLMNVPLPILRQPLRNLSKTIQQIDLRLQQLCFWPPQYFQWLERTEKLEPEAQAQYIGFWNTVWLIANDVILGIAIGATLVEFSDLFAETFSAILQHYDHQLDDIMTWLLNWPGGLKLNSELSSFFGDLYRWMLFAWRYTIETNASFIQLFLLLGGRCGVLGCTMILAILSDLITLSTLHLHLLYAVSCRIYYWQVSIMFSTFHLFQGRKYNPLRKRIDAAEYELDQTLIGAIIFTLLIFLLPTVGAYYLLFSIGRICVFMLLSVFEICLAILNHFPLFALLLRLKDPKRLPGRIYDGRTSLF